MNSGDGYLKYKLLAYELQAYVCIGAHTTGSVLHTNMIFYNYNKIMLYE